MASNVSSILFRGECHNLGGAITKVTNGFDCVLLGVEMSVRYETKKGKRESNWKFYVTRKQRLNHLRPHFFVFFGFLGVLSISNAIMCRNQLENV